MMIANKHAGFSLLELFFTLLIFSLLVYTASPSFFALFQRHHAHASIDKLFHTLQFARMEAIMRNQMVSVCPSQNLQYCSQDWSQGLIVYISKEGNLHFPEKILRTETFSPQITLSSDLHTIHYLADGRCLSRGILTAQSKNKNFSKIILYDSGRARIET